MSTKEIERRKPVWLAISAFYLDTELDYLDISRTIEVFYKSGFTLSELKDIDFLEVKPILGSNPSSVTGIWTGFDEKWLFNEIENKTLNRSRKNNLFTKWRRKIFDSNRYSYWNQYKSEFQVLSSKKQNKPH